MAPTQQDMPPPLLSVLETTLVRPSPTAGAAPPESSLPLTFFDVLWLTSPPVERVFFYRLAADADVATILSNLKTSLSRALHAYYPLAGHLRLKPGTADRYELYYQPGDGVTFTVAEYCDDADVEELASDEPKKVAKIAPLAPTLPEGGAVLALQATVLHGGLAIGMAVHHAACDGASSTRFLHAWAAAGTGADAPPPPVIDRTLIKDPRSRLYDFFVKAPTADQMECVKMSDDQLFATLTLSKEDIQRVKDVVAGEAGRRGAAPPRCSSLVATFGFIWSCYQRAKDEESNRGDRRTYLCFPIDHRSRMKPPVPDEYLGNCVGAAMHAAPEDQLAVAGAGGLFVACMAVAAAIEEAVGGVRSPETIESWIERFKEAAVAGTGMLTVAGSPRFRVYEVDLGFGRPAKVDIVSVARTGAMAVAEGRSSGGGMEVGISLPSVGNLACRGSKSASSMPLRFFTIEQVIH
ncbi:hypothetical protein ACQ4PT_046829 [Festuca glaucescens]